MAASIAAARPARGCARSSRLPSIVEHDRLGGPPDLGDRRRQPAHGGRLARLPASGEERAPELGAVVDQEHACARPPRRERRGQTRRSSAHHEHVAMDVPPVVSTAVHARCETTDAAHATGDEAVDELDARGSRQRASQPGPSSCTSVLGSSAQAPKMPRGRPVRMPRPTVTTSFARSAEARVSPAHPSYAVPSKTNRRGRERSIRPPDGRRRGPPACGVTAGPAAPRPADRRRAPRWSRCRGRR
jgi:hypothetical protein